MTSMAPESSLAPWEAYAAAWDEGMGDEGNEYFRFLELPILDRMIDRRQGYRALDLATGNGLVARWLAQQGVSVLATDGAPAMVEVARARTNQLCREGKLPADNPISFQTLDVTSQEFWVQFIGGISSLHDGFDIVTMNMALMDIPDIKPLASSLKQILKPGGCFIATLLHPLFFTSGADRQILIHEDPATGERSIERAIILKKYWNVPPARQLIFSGDKVSKPPYWFHRPLQELFAPFFHAGLAMDALEETNFDDSFRDSVREHASKNFVEFPKILGFRMKNVG